MLYHLHICPDCLRKWADNMIKGRALCPQCGHIVDVKDEGQISEEACPKLGVRYRRV